MADIRGLDPQGRPRDVSVTNEGEVLAAGRVFKTQRIEIPGIGTAAAYASGDAFGGKFLLDVPPMGIIASVVFLDLDDEGINKEVVLFDRDFTATADNSAFNVSDADLLNCIGVLSVDTWFDFGANRIGVGSPALGYSAPSGRLYCQVVTRGIDNIASGNLPKLFLAVTV